MVTTVKGDVFRSGAGIIAHGCNCRGGYGSGVAGIMARKYPKARNAYIEKFQTEGWQLGDVQFVGFASIVIANCATQKAYLPRGRRHVDYDAIRTCMIKVKEFAKVSGLTVAMPKIGAGLAGGDWGTIKKILKEVFTDYDVTVYHLD